MKISNLLIPILACILAGCELSVETESSKPIKEYQMRGEDSARWGADDYGMKKYVMALLYRGDNQSIDSAERLQLQRQHLKNIERLAGENVLVLAGPFFGSDDLRGIYVFNVSSITEAEKLTQTDPAIQAGTLRMELKEWYGSAALMGLNEQHQKLAKKSIVPDE